MVHQRGLPRAALGGRNLTGKYRSEVLLPMFRKAADLRESMLAEGFTDNGGAIHSASRILDILGQRVCYPGLSHINGLRSYPGGEFTESAWKAHNAGERVLIEHVSPLRALTVAAIALHTKGASDDEILDYVRRHYRLVHLTAAETSALNKRNRSKLDPERIGHLRLVKRPVHNS